MIINTNMSALKAHRYSAENNTMISKSHTKVTSGSRINSAADDPSGMAIASKMMAQKRGLERAEMNIGEGIDLLTVADGAAATVADMANRIRELAIYASNDTLTDEDRQLVQREVSQLKDGVDISANGINYNSILVAAPPIITEGGGTGSGEVDIVFVVDRTGSMGGIITNVRNNLSNFVNTMSAMGIDVRLGLVTYGDVNISGETTQTTAFTNDVDAFIASLAAIPVNGGGDEPESGLEGILTGIDYFDFRSDASRQFILLTDANMHTTSTGGSAHTIDGVVQALKDNDISLTIVGNPDMPAPQNTLELADKAGSDFINIKNPSFADDMEVLANKIGEGAISYQLDEIPPLYLQIGANEMQMMKIQLEDLRSRKTGLDKCDVSTLDKAKETIAICDKVLEIIAEARGRYGSYMNRLGHSQQYAAVGAMNTADAMSRIKDADIAKEMMEYTKRSIMLNSSISMLGQANQEPQRVAYLLRPVQ